MFDVLRQDLRFAMRVLHRNPMHVALTTATLAIGIGAATAMFSVLNGVLLRPLPMRQQDRLVQLGYEMPLHHLAHLPVSFTTFGDYQRTTHALSDIAAFEFHGAEEWTMRVGESAVMLSGTRVTGNFFRVLGTAARFGRVLRPEDDVPGADPVLVISSELWRRRFGADPQIVGRRIQSALFGVMYTIVGVLPEGLRYPSGVDAWVPFATFWPPALGADMRNVNVYPVGRLAPGQSAAQAQADLGSLLRRSLDPPWNADARAIGTTIPTVLLADARPAVWTLTAAVALLLLIACANVANLLLMRGSARHGEFRVRAAIGAGRGRMVRQLLTEHVLLATLGGMAGVGVASAGVRLLRRLPVSNLPRLDAIHLDTRALAGAAGLTLASAVLFGLLPAFTVARSDLAAPLHRVAAARRPARARHLLVAAQVAITIIMLSGAALLIRSLARLEHVDVGFSPEGVVVAQVNLPIEKFGPQLSHLYSVLDQEVERVRALPGVTAAGVTALAPFAPTTGFFALTSAAESGTGKSGGGVRANTEYVGPGYFSVLGITLQRGRAIAAIDRADAPPVAVVSASLARALWPDADPIGKRIRLGDDSALTIVGVAADTRYRDIRAANPVVYRPYVQLYGMVPLYLLVRTRRSTDAMVPPLRRTLAAIDPDLTIARASGMTEWLDAPLARSRFDTALSALFGGLALALASIGIYGVMAAFVSLRTREIGVRMAIGASSMNVRVLVLARAGRLVLPGIAVGLAASVAITRMLRSQLFEITPTDPAAFAAVTLVALVVTAVACWVPMRAAARLDPVTALRSPD